MKQRVSVIVPVYNVENYLRRCIDSIVRQSYSNLEILLVDDGSQDASLSICKEYETKDSRIRVFHKENEGLGLARNYGIERATGEYITFVDSDDYLTLDAIEFMLKKAIVTDADVVIASHYYKNEEQEVRLAERLYCGTEIKETLMVHMMGNKGNRLDALSYTAWGKLYKKELFVKNHLEFPSERKFVWEDLTFSVEAITDQPMRQIVAEIIREKALYALNEEIPHGIAVVIDQMKDRPNGKIVDIDATIICERDSHKGIIIGKQGAMLKKIGSNARYELEQMLEQKVNLKLWVKVKKDWRDSDFLVKNFGYDKKKLEL